MSFGTVEGWVHNSWTLNEENSRTIIKQALNLGINFFDTANVYAYGQSEKILGRAIKDFANRDEVVVARKIFGKMREGANGGFSRKYILSQIDQSLKRLGIDYVGLYIVYRWDYHTPTEETLETLMYKRSISKKLNPGLDESYNRIRTECVVYIRSF